ncbi:histone-lysine N-methyltransferase, H3 lysine-9 specific SUVH4-like [Canna indica]|uniref:Histone-lysine N-methyltransferase, H3 lysine-9 specific SUVH4-like n=1 Tax=Canna indica TaxID=4628 RepID=A0AAQ3KFA0_9LILI|nr:histone-lysine N-methyltransferase, H3 lysine-9 specific SUVH4-like [Canna indica]
MRCSNPPVVDSPALDLGNNAAADGQTCQGMIGGSSKSNQDDKLGLLDDGLEQGPKASGALETAGSRKRPYTSNLCSCSRKRPAVAIRDFPVGCGINAPRMTREEALKLVAEEMSPIEDMPPPTEDPHPTATSQDSASPKVATSNEETVQEREAEVKVSDFLPPPNIEILEAEKQAIDGEGDHFPGK